ncbi:hypothetical protein BGZ67_001519 [Mortierella alpina]|nr:hypothetical protein BGZ67_001519 [Mortierella alpina]
MDVPEILALVAIQLDGPRLHFRPQRDLAVCARVCKDWHATFMPFLYRSLCLGLHSTTPSSKQDLFPSPEVLLAYCHLVQELHLDLDSPHSLVLQQTTATDALQNLTLLELKAHKERPVEPNGTDLHWIWRITKNSSHLTTLCLNNMVLDWPRLLAVLTNCRRLDKLSCNTCTFIGSWDAATVTTNITDLQLEDSSGEGKVSLVDWMQLCPRLEALSVTKDRTPWLGPVSQFSPGPQLWSLELDCVLLKEVELIQVLARCPSLKKITLAGASITRPVFAALSGHFDSLAWLDILTLPKIEPWMVKRILECCPRLASMFLSEVDVNSLYTTTLDDREDDLPWACRDSLKELCIIRIQMSLEVSVNDRFMKRLMDLKRLEELFIMSIYRGDGTRRPLKPQYVPGDTPEALLLAKLCACRNWELSGDDLRQGPTWRLIRDTWPALVWFSYNGSDGEFD